MSVVSERFCIFRMCEVYFPLYPICLVTHSPVDLWPYSQYTVIGFIYNLFKIPKVGLLSITTEKKLCNACTKDICEEKAFYHDKRQIMLHFKSISIKLCSNQIPVQSNNTLFCMDENIFLLVHIDVHCECIILNINCAFTNWRTRHNYSLQ